MHKAGSAFAADVVRSVFLDNGWRCYDFATAAFNAGLNELEHVKSKVRYFENKRSFFGPIRAEAVSLVPNLPNLTPIIHIRDPRDCLVSYYYSICFSHVLTGPGPERDRFLRIREYCKSLNVDDFCLEVLTNGDRSFQFLRAAAEANTAAIISRYEDMVADISDWLRNLVARLPVEVGEDKLARLKAENEPPIKEDIFCHKRQVTPGDFRRKLKLDSQRKLTAFFFDDLKYFGYSTDLP